MAEVKKKSERGNFFMHHDRTSHFGDGDVERWTHDRYKENEQQPKSRTELILAYGYDIRVEDGPPRLTKVRAPAKISSNREDHRTKIKINKKERKVRSCKADFSALHERTTREERSEQRERDYNTGDEKGNPSERQRTPANQSSVNDRLNIASVRSTQNEDLRNHEDIRAQISGKPKIEGKQPAGSDRQVALELKPIGRNAKHTVSQQKQKKQQQSNNTHNNSRSDECGNGRPQQQGFHDQTGSQNSSVNEQFQQRPLIKGGQSVAASNAVHMWQNPQRFYGDNYNNNNNQTTKYNEQLDGCSQQQQQQQGRTQLRCPLTLTSTPPPSKWWQLQNRSDPSHVGSVQIHAVARQNPQQQKVTHADIVPHTSSKVNCKLRLQIN